LQAVVKQVLIRKTLGELSCYKGCYRLVCRWNSRAIKKSCAITQLLLLNR